MGLLTESELKNIYDKIPFEISKEKKEEIAKLDFVSLARIRTNYTFKTFGRLFVLGRAPSSTTGVKPITNWWCICSCNEHKIIPVRVNNLTSNNSKSCGCLDVEKSTERLKEINNRNKPKLEGQTIGNFLIIEDTKERKYNSIVWRAKCLLCGNDNYLITSNVLLNHTPKSCGCELRSKGAILIEEILNKNNLLFEKEKTFDNCKFMDSNTKGRFDYYVNNSFLIEYDGEQHFKKCDQSYFKDSLEKRQEHDKYKNQWCLENNIPLYRIPYWELDNIKTLEDIFNYRVTKEIS